MTDNSYTKQLEEQIAALEKRLDTNDVELIAKSATLDTAKECVRNLMTAIVSEARTLRANMELFKGTKEYSEKFTAKSEELIHICRSVTWCSYGIKRKMEDLDRYSQILANEPIHFAYRGERDLIKLAFEAHYEK